jgi:phosphoribosylamine--glycine ligase
MTNDNLQIFHAGTAAAPGSGFVTSGGRVLGVTAADATLEQALVTCYGAINDISWEGMQYRRDIGRLYERMKASS